MHKHSLALALSLFATPALATTAWDVDVNKSKITFEAKQSGEEVVGHFRKFKPNVEIDLDKPESAHIQITVDISSLDIDDKEPADALPTDDWLAEKKYPTAEFSSLKINLTNKTEQMYFYQASGDLKIRGIRKQVDFPFVVRKERGEYVRAIGEMAINRKDFSVGQGRWEDDKWIAYPVKIHFNLLAKPK